MKDKQRTRLEREFREDLEALLGIVWTLAEEQGSYPELAKRAGLAYSTIHKLWWGVTQRPQFMTIQKLAFAVDLDVSFRGGRLHVSNMDRESSVNPNTKRRVAPGELVISA